MATTYKPSKLRSQGNWISLVSLGKTMLLRYSHFLSFIWILLQKWQLCFGCPSESKNKEVLGIISMPLETSNIVQGSI
jgi:hypothetical protein